MEITGFEDIQSTFTSIIYRSESCAIGQTLLGPVSRLPA